MPSYKTQYEYFEGTKRLVKKAQISMVIPAAVWGTVREAACLRDESGTSYVVRAIIKALNDDHNLKNMTSPPQPFDANEVKMRHKQDPKKPKGIYVMLPPTLWSNVRSRAIQGRCSMTDVILSVLEQTFKTTTEES